MKKILSTTCLLILVIAGFAQEIRIATYRYSTNDRVANLEPFARLVEQKTGIRTSVKSYPTVLAFIEGIRNNEVDLAMINTFGYLLLQTSAKTYPMDPVVALTVPSSSKDNYKTAILVRSNSMIKDMATLNRSAKGQRLALVAVGSTSGNLVPRLGLTGIGIDKAESAFDTVVYAGTHKAAVEWLLQDKADIAAMGHDAYLKMAEEGPAIEGQLRTIWLSPEIPLGPVLFHKSMDPKLKETLLQLLLGLHISQPEALTSIKNGWTEAKQATHYITIHSNHYTPFLQQFGKPEAVAAILEQFAN